MAAAPPAPSLSTLLDTPLEVAEPDVCDALAVFPLFGPAPRLAYRSFAEAAAGGAKIIELPEGASVGQVLVVNPLDVPVLLYEGEELRGAQQDRTVDSAVLVPARSELPISVSCVERDRWDGARESEPFSPSPQAAFPALRAAKSRRMRESLADGMPARADQAEVWQHVEERIEAVGGETETFAMHDAYRAGGDGLHRLQSGVARRDGQVGCLVAIGREWVVLDYVSRADVFAALHRPLVAGYALDAVGRTATPTPPSAADARGFLEELAAAAAMSRPSPGLGRTLAFSAAGGGGTALAVDRELVQLSAYADDHGPGGTGPTNIRRPSRRR